MRFELFSLSLLVAASTSVFASVSEVPHQELIGAYRLSQARCGAREIPTNDFVTYLQVEREALIFTTVQDVQVKLVRDGRIVEEFIHCRTVQNALLEPNEASPSLLALSSTHSRTVCTDVEGATVSDRSSHTESKAGVLAYTLREPSLRLIYLNSATAPCPGTDDGLELNFERASLKDET